MKRSGKSLLVLFVVVIAFVVPLGLCTGCDLYTVPGYGYYDYGYYDTVTVYEDPYYYDPYYYDEVVYIDDYYYCDPYYE